jgi:DNA-binding NarL/FixJ family response regulator
VIRVLIVDDHPVVRAGIGALVSGVEGMEVAGLAESGEQAIAMAASQDLDVVLMDASMPGCGGIEATRRIARAGGPRVVMLSTFSEHSRVLDALDAGAAGYLVKDADAEDIIAAIVAAARGEAPLAPCAAAALLSARGTTAPHLSDREREVLTLVARGLPNKLIAGRLGIAEKTVKTHLTGAYRAIGVSGRMEAALWARERGMAGRVA